MRKRLQDLTIKDAFMFAAVMSDAEQCRHLLELVEAGTKRRFNVEMQVKTESALAKRSRYYHAQMDMDALLAGESYDKLPDTYVIFICDFAPFDSRLYRYNIRNVVRETNELLKDGNQTI